MDSSCEPNAWLEGSLTSCARFPRRGSCCTHAPLSPPRRALRARWLPLASGGRRPSGTQRRSRRDRPRSASDYARAEPDSSNAPPATGAWVDYDRDAIGNRSGTPCSQTGSWTLGTTGDLGGYLNVTGAVGSSYCNVVRPLACCRAAPKKVFRGFTAASFTGNLGGVLGANSKCRADYPGSYLCTSSDYALAETTSVPSAAGAWIDYDRDELGNRSGTPCSQTGSWTLGTTGDLGGYLNLTGAVGSSYCNVVRPLACCAN